MADLKKLLTKGLETGYAGGTTRQTVTRGPFKLEASEFPTPEGGVYRDEWIADRTGGGQELVQIAGQAATRLYAGGVIRLEELTKLGLTKKDVIKYLKAKVLELGEKTRLLADCRPEPDGDWQYLYEIIRDLPEVPLTVALESIRFKGTLVFAHGFLHSSVE